MKAYKVEVLVLDFENYGKEQIDLMLGDVRGLSCSVRGIEEADIGAWSDEHPLNHRSTSDQEFKRLFPVLQLEAQQAGDVALLNKVRQAVAGYYDALTARQHGVIAQNQALNEIEQALGMSWYDYKEKQGRKA